MAKKSLIDILLDKKQTKAGKSQHKSAASVESDDTVIDHLWMTEDHDKNKKKPVVKKDPRIDTGILRDQIANKITKLNNH